MMVEVAMVRRVRGFEVFGILVAADGGWEIILDGLSERGEERYDAVLRGGNVVTERLCLCWQVRSLR